MSRHINGTQFCHPQRETVVWLQSYEYRGENCRMAPCRISKSWSPPCPVSKSIDGGMEEGTKCLLGHHNANSAPYIFIYNTVCHK